MKKNHKAKQEQQGRAQKQPRGVTELTAQDLEQVQGGQGFPNFQKVEFKD